MKVKSVYHLNNKGYVQLDFSFAVLIFVTLLISFYFIYDSYQKNLNDNYEFTKLDSDSKDLCFFLISNTGNPINWNDDINNSLYIGFKNTNSSSLNSSKISSISNSNYLDIISKLNLNHYSLYISLTGVTSNTRYFIFGVSSNNLATYKSSYSCFTNYNSEISIMEVEIWK